MIPRFRPPTGMSEIVAALRPGGAGAVETYEKAFAEALGQRFAIAFPYGRTALRLTLETWGLEGAEIICPSYTCVVVPHAIVAAGAVPVFVDSDVDANMDLDAAERAIGPRTRAIVATSIFGHPVNLDRLDEIRRRHPGLLVIQDCAHSFACEWTGRPVQAAGDVTIFGCNISKVATSIFGGVATTDNPATAERLRAMRDSRMSRASVARSIMRAAYLVAATAAFTEPLYRLVEILRRLGLMSALEDYFDPETIEMPRDHLVRVTGIEARVGAVQAGRIASFVATRRAMAASYRKVLEGHPGLRFLPSPDGSSYSHIAAVVADRPSLLAAAKRQGVELGRIIDYSCADMPAYANYSGSGDCPVAAFFARHVINLPVRGIPDASLVERVVSRLAPILPTTPPPEPPLQSK